MTNATKSSVFAPPQTAILLSAEGLCKSFGGDVVLDHIDLSLQRGEVVLLSGENGSGKTTLLNILTGNIEPDSGVIHFCADDTPRSYHFPRRWWQELNPLDHFAPEFAAREGVGRTWQDVRLFGSLSLRDNIAVARRSRREGPFAALNFLSRAEPGESALGHAADGILAQLDLQGRELSSADKISFGQSKRIAIARAVAANARVLFLDEPLAGLDREGITQVLGLLRELVAHHHTLVIVEHALNHDNLHGLVTTEWCLANGRMTVSPAQRPAAATQPARLMAPAWVRLLRPSDAMVFHESLPRGAVLTRVVPHRDPKSSRQAVLTIRDLIVMRGSRMVIGEESGGLAKGLNLVLYEGEMAILQAPNGWGKSTLLQAIAGLLPITRGEILLDVERIDTIPTWDRVDAGISVLTAENQRSDSLTAGEFISLAGGSIEHGTQLKGLAQTRMSVLSGGQRQAIVLASLRSARLGVYDEPFSSLDANRLEQLSFPATGASLFLLPHSGFTAPPTGTGDQLQSIPVRTLRLWWELERRNEGADHSFELSAWLPSAKPLRQFVNVAPVLPSSLALLEYLRRHAPVDQRLLDFGCGSGVLAVAAALLGAKSVDALDLNPDAVNATAANAALQSVAPRINSFVSNGFDNVTARYDVILANLPIIDAHSGVRSPVDPFGLFDADFALHVRFRDSLHHHLQPKGHALLCHAQLQPHWSFANFENFMQTGGYTCKCVHESNIDGITWRVYRLDAQNPPTQTS